MANPPKPWKVEYAKSSRSSCKTCKTPIEKEKLRIGKMVQATQFDGFMPMWNHADCILKKAKQIKSTEDVEGIDSLRWEDQQKIRKYTEGSLLSNSASVVKNECGIEVSQTSRATCKLCNKKIMKGEVRISVKPEGQGARSLSWHHSNCYVESSPQIQVGELFGWGSLPISEQKSFRELCEKYNSNDKNKVQQDEGGPPISNGGTKRRKGATSDQKSKALRTDENASISWMPMGDDLGGLRNNDSILSDLESKLEAQTKKMWAIKDELKKHVTITELREMLEANDQDSSGSEFDLRDRCADGMLFGPLGECPACSGPLSYSGGKYRCRGYLSEWSRCSFSTTEAQRLHKKWKIPEESSNQYLCQWFKSQKANKPVRVLPPPSSNTALKGLAVCSSPQSSEAKRLEGLKIAITGSPREFIEEWKDKVEGAGGTFHVKVKKDTKCLVVRGNVDDENPEIRKARRLKVPILREEYLVECNRQQMMLPFDNYKIETVTNASKSMVTVKVKGRSAVHESSGLQYSGHILEDGKSIYNTTLNMSDLTTGINSYYILQVIQEDNGSDCFVFRKWGRVGNDNIGGSKLEDMSKCDAIREFKRLFLEKTGNPWEAWEQKKFQKQPGRFFPLDIDYGVHKQVPKKQNLDLKSRLARPLVELMKMLFNIDTYRAAMMEFEINMSEMPLGRLSKSNIQQGFEALTEIQNLLNSNHDPSLKESLLVDASNRFFTLIPSIHPHVIKGEDDFRSKVKMLEALQDIEIASRIVGFDGENDDSLDEKYMKLNCEIAPLPHDSEDYLLIEKYLQTTHAPTHTEWALELEEVFKLERVGEYDKFVPFREKLKNKMLLWHGSRLTNFVGIISQGLRIAPPEAPATGYMFGKGIYFADMVSKSAQYCYSDKTSPVGLMLLSEVALGSVYELKKASYMEKPPEGKDSTKGLGKIIPSKSGYVEWRDGVTVPSGKPVPSNIKASELMYNEYIVYNTSQVKLQFLLKVRFHHKR
ncbi:hypothetical protein Scep_029870 [Stephania cephalantha]|uniref:Poly [ADP-ribose] polymerase n=1 Tax=Stephania cephalantha TaxID=152367 RepID=A0AAP0HDV6_9MAGN